MLRVILVEPHYAGNIGSVARLVENFEVDELYIVSPVVSPFSDEAMVWAANAKHVLERSRIVGRVDDAVKDCAVVVATTAKPDFKTVRRTVISPSELAGIALNYVYSKERLAIMFGREPSGLTNEEIDIADFTVTIPTSAKYPTMNLSHSVAIILYEIYKARLSGKGQIETAPGLEDFKKIEGIFEKLSEITERKNPRVVMHSFRAVLRRGVKTKKELNAILGVLAEVLRLVGEGDTQRLDGR